MLEGAMEPKTIADKAAKLGFPAIAVTDRNGLYGVMPFSDACIAKGVQPIVGAMLAVARPPEIGGEAAIDWLVLLAKDDEGYANLCKLVSAAHLDRPVEQEPHVDFASLAGFSGPERVKVEVSSQWLGPRFEAFRLTCQCDSRKRFQPHGFVIWKNLTYRPANYVAQSGVFLEGRIAIQKPVLGWLPVISHQNLKDAETFVDGLEQLPVLLFRSSLGGYAVGDFLISPLPIDQVSRLLGV